MNSAARRSRYDNRNSAAQLDRIFARDEGICQLCGFPVRREFASRDHIKDFALCTVEEARDDNNVQLAHLDCNNKKHWPEKAKIRTIKPSRVHLTYIEGEMFPDLQNLFYESD